MPTKYSRIAIEAYHLLLEDPARDPNETWLEVAKNHCPNAPSSAKKSCPKSGFRILCAKGYLNKLGKIGNIGNISKKVIERHDKAYQILTKIGDKEISPNDLWERVTGKEDNENYTAAILALRNHLVKH